VRAQALSSHSGFPSDTNQLVDACIARVRATAASAGSGASGTSTQRGPRRSAGARSRWAVAFCAMIASAFGTAAFLASPIGHAPQVLRATTAARAHASAAAHAMAALFTR
jgi:hypothetical protein